MMYLAPDIPGPPAFPFAFGRIRSTKIEGSDRISAHYLKLYPSIQIEGRVRAGMRVKMTYYLNTTRDDRNLEFLPSQNLYVKHDQEEPLDNLNLIEKDRYSIRASKAPDLIRYRQLSHYKAGSELLFVE